MPDQAFVLLSVALGVALAAAALLTLRRSGTVAAATREAAASRRALRDYGVRADTALGPMLDRIDSVRRRLVEPAAVVLELSAAKARVDELVAEARSLAVVPSMRQARDAVVSDIERAARALDMVDYGCGVLATSRPRGHELEAQTAIKRGYLNLLHAREAIVRHAAEGPSGGDHRRDLRRAAD